MRPWIFIQSCPGRERLLRETVRSLIHAGAPWEAIVVCIDGTCEDILQGALSLWPESRGNLQSFIQIMSIAAKSIADDDLVLFVEDDVQFCKNAIPRIFATGVPKGLPFTTFFDMKEFFPGTPYGLYRVPLKGIDGRGFWGLQCVLFTAEAVRHFANSPLPAEKAKTLRNHSDMVLAETLATRYDSDGSGSEIQYDSYAAHVPCLVEHVGAEQSAIWKFQEHEITRRATNYPGRGFDALTLPVYGEGDPAVPGRAGPPVESEDPKTSG